MSWAPLPSEKDNPADSFPYYSEKGIPIPRGGRLLLYGGAIFQVGLGGALCVYGLATGAGLFSFVILAIFCGGALLLGLLARYGTIVGPIRRR